MCAANGVALILFGNPAYTSCASKSRSATRGACHRPDKAEQSVEDFEVFLDHCDFCLLSQNASVVHLAKVDIGAGSADAGKLLPNVRDWTTVLSRYRFHVKDAEEAKLLQTEFVWTLKLHDIRLDASLRRYDRGEEYITSVVCFPQSWLGWVDNAWFMNNIDICWFMQRGDTFGVPSCDSVRWIAKSDCARGRHYFRTCFVRNAAGTAITEGTTAVRGSSVPLLSPYTDSEVGIVFPEDGYMYVILFDLPSSYQIDRREVHETRECVLCGDECVVDDAGLVFGICGHYVCGKCYDECKDKMQAVKRCFYCRRETSVGGTVESTQHT